MSLELIVSGHQPGRGRAAGDARRARLHRHRRGADHRGGPGVHRGDAPGPAGPAPGPGRPRVGRGSATGAPAPGPDRGPTRTRDRRSPTPDPATAPAARPTPPPASAAGGGSPASPSPRSSSSSWRRSPRRTPTGSSASPRTTGSSARRRTSSPACSADYAIPGIDDPRLSTILSGLLGVAIVVGVVFLLGRVLARRTGLGAPRPGARPLRRGRQPVPPGRRPAQVHPDDRRDPGDLAAADRVVPGPADHLAGPRGLLRDRRASGPFRLSRSAVVALPFALAAFPLIFTVQEQIVATITIGPLDLTISAEGLRRFLTIMTGSWLSVQVALLLAFTTPFHDLVDAPPGAARCRGSSSRSSRSCTATSPCSTDEGSRMLRARDARSAAGRGLGGRLHPVAGDRHRAHGRLAVPPRLRAQRADLRGDAGARLRGRVPPPAGPRPPPRRSSPGCSSLLALFALYEVIAVLWLPRQ